MTHAGTPCQDATRNRTVAVAAEVPGPGKASHPIQDPALGSSSAAVPDDSHAHVATHAGLAAIPHCDV